MIRFINRYRDKLIVLVLVAIAINIFFIIKGAL